MFCFKVKLHPHPFIPGVNEGKGMATKAIQMAVAIGRTAVTHQDEHLMQTFRVEAIQKKDFPKWKLKIQVMSDTEASGFRWNPFDLTKIWPHKDFPLIEVGVMELNEVPENYFAEIEQAAFAPAHVVDGIGYSPDKMLQGRLLSYPDAHRHRLGANYEQIPVNKCPYLVTNYQRDGQMRVDGNAGSEPNYWPNSFDGIYADPSYKEPPMEMKSTIADWYDRNGENDNDHYTQPGNLFRTVMNDEEKHKTIHNIIGAMGGISGPKRDLIVNRQLCHWFRADANLGMAVAKGLGVNVDEIMREMKHEPAAV